MAPKWRIIYTDGSGRKEGAAAAAVAKDMKGGNDQESSRYLGKIATAPDAERAAIGLASNLPGAMNLILTDFQAALATALYLAKGQPPRSSIEVEIKGALRNRRDEDTGIAWIRRHIGIRGNEQADRLASFKSVLGDIVGEPTTTTEGGVRQASKATRAS